MGGLAATKETAMTESAGATPSPVVLPPELDPRRPRRRNRPLRILTAAASAGIVAVSLTGFVSLNHYESKITRVPVFAGLNEDARPDKPETSATNILLVGSDSRDGLTRSEIAELHVGAPDSGRRSDSMMLLHLDEDWSRATVVSFPRDSYVTLPEYTTEDGTVLREERNKLNAAYATGGPGRTIATIEEATGIRIDHYVEVGFDGFVNAVDAVGGVEVCTEKALYDRRAGLDLPAGTSELDGGEALAYVRARYVDSSSDLGRMERQQDFLASLFRKATSSGVLLNPVRLNGLLDATLSSISTDAGLSRDLLLQLATQMRQMAAGNVVFTTVPIADADYRPGNVGSTVRWDDVKAEELFTAIRADQPLGGQTTEATGATPAPTSPPVTKQPGSIRLKVLNASGQTGVARTTADKLAEVGFAISGVGNAERVSGTEIRYDPRWSESVKTVQAALPGARAVAVEGQGGTFTIVVGSPEQAVVPVTVVAAASPKPTGTANTPAIRSAAENLCG
jgi:LCP family protein required for cell wall assembly